MGEIVPGLFVMLLAPLFMITMFLILARRVNVGGKSYKNMQAFNDAVTAATGWTAADRPQGFLSSLTDAGFTGEVRGRAVEITFGGPRPYEARVAVAAEKAPHLVLSLEGIISAIGKAVGVKHDIQIGVKEFDERFLVESNEPGRAKKALEDQAAREAVESIFAHYGPERVESVRGQVVAVFPAMSFRIADASKLAQRLGALADALDPVRVHSTAALAAHARCGYCHEEIAPDAEDVLACELCATVIHKDCRAELGRCAVAGCEGRAPVHARVKT